MVNEKLVYMGDCVFCKIVAGVLPAYRVYEDERYVAFLDIRPLVKGQVLVIPKKHCRWVWEVENFGEYWEVARKVAEKVRHGMVADFVSFLTVGMEIEHAHIWIIPRMMGQGLEMGEEAKRLELAEDEMAEVAEKIRAS